jgi:hypothetical protein
MNYAKIYIDYLIKQSTPEPQTAASATKQILPWHKNAFGASHAERAEAKRALVQLEIRMASLQTDHRNAKGKKDKDSLSAEIKRSHLKKNELMKIIGAGEPDEVAEQPKGQIHE